MNSTHGPPGTASGQRCERSPRAASSVVRGVGFPPPSGTLRRPDVCDAETTSVPSRGQAAPRLDTLAGKTVGFISNGKEGTKGFFGHLDRVLREEYGVKNVVFRTKSNYSAPADPHIVAEIGQWDAVISGIGD